MAGPRKGLRNMRRLATVLKRRPWLRTTEREPRLSSRIRHFMALALLASPAAAQSIQGTVKGERGPLRSEEHTSELQSHVNLVCRLLLEKKKKRKETNASQLH